MNIHTAIRASQIHVAIRPSLLPPPGTPSRGRSRRCRAFEQERRIWEHPFIAASNLVRFHPVTDEPVYETRVYNNSGTPMALVLASKLDDWEPLDRGDPITLLSDLAGEDQLVARQERVTERKRSLEMQEGREWTCPNIAAIYRAGESGTVDPFGGPLPIINQRLFQQPPPPAFP